MLIINATQIKKRYSGVGVYCIKVVEKLINKFNKGKIYLGLNIFENTNKNWQVKIVSFIERGVFRWLWIIFILPFRLNKKDVLYCPFSEAPILFRGKLVLVVHDLIPLKFPERHSKKLKCYYSKILPISLRKAYSIIAISNTTKADIVKYFPEIDAGKINVIYNGYDKNIFNSKTNKAELNKFKSKYNLTNYILYVGRLSKIKNVLTLVKAYGKIFNQTDCNLLIVGKNESDNYQEFMNYIIENGFENRVTFIEWVIENELQYLYKGASLFVFPSLSEGFGMPVIEAMACGIPVIISDIQTLSEIADDAVLKFNPLDIDELSKKMLLLLKDESLRNNYIEKGLEKVKSYSWEKTAEKTYNILKTAMR